MFSCPLFVLALRSGACSVRPRPLTLAGLRCVPFVALLPCPSRSPLRSPPPLPPPLLCPSLPPCLVPSCPSLLFPFTRPCLGYFILLKNKRDPLQCFTGAIEGVRHCERTSRTSSGPHTWSSRTSSGPHTCMFLHSVLILYALPPFRPSPGGLAGSWGSRGWGPPWPRVGVSRVVSSLVPALRCVACSVFVPSFPPSPLTLAGLRCLPFFPAPPLPPPLLCALFPPVLSCLVLLFSSPSHGRV